VDRFGEERKRREGDGFARPFTCGLVYSVFTVQDEEARSGDARGGHYPQGERFLQSQSESKRVRTGVRDAQDFQDGRDIGFPISGAGLPLGDIEDDIHLGFLNILQEGKPAA